MKANLVNLETVSVSFGTTTVLDAVSLGIARGERIGIVGRNGGGKSTLLDTMAGRREPDSGRVTHARDLTIGYLGQTDDLDSDATVRHAVLRDRAEHEWAADARLRDIVEQLLGRVGLDRRVGDLSGGERRRAALATVLLDDPDLIVADEPTNHLDLVGIAWLARHLAGRKGALLLVTHDRWLLDEVTTLTWEVHDGQVDSYDGGYAAYVLAKAERVRMAEASYARRQNLLRKELAWLRRGPPARTSKPKFRIDAANLLISGEPPARDRLALERLAIARLGKDVVDVEDATYAHPGAEPILTDLTFRVGPGDRFGFLGLNGAGKSTLLGLLTGALRSGSGRVRIGKTVTFAVLSQSLAEVAASKDQMVAEYVTGLRRRADSGELTGGQLLEQFGFTGQRLATRLSDLSGGELRRLQLLRILLEEPNVLVLDEPTNDLDIETLQVLEDFLDSWPGTLLVVSHDRYFLERVTDQTYAVGAPIVSGGVRHLPRGVDQYLELLAAAPAASGGARSAGTAAAGTPSSITADLRAARKTLARIENQLTKLDARANALHERLAAAATDYPRLLELDAELRAVTEQREALEGEWLSAAEAIEGTG